MPCISKERNFTTDFSPVYQANGVRTDRSASRCPPIGASAKCAPLGAPRQVRLIFPNLDFFPAFFSDLTIRVYSCKMITTVKRALTAAIESL